MRRPLGDRVLVRQLEAEEKTTGGIIIPTQAQERPARGIVLAVGPGRVDSSGDLVPVEIQVGDEVDYSKFGGVKVSISDYNESGKLEELMILREGEVLLVKASGVVK